MVKHSQPASLLPFPVADVAFQNSLRSFYVLIFSPGVCGILPREDTGRSCGKQNARQHPCATPIPGTRGYGPLRSKEPCRGDDLTTRALADSGRKVPAQGLQPQGLRTVSTGACTSVDNLEDRTLPAGLGANSLAPSSRALRRDDPQPQPGAGIRRNTKHGSSLSPHAGRRMNPSLAREPRRHPDVTGPPGASGQGAERPARFPQARYGLPSAPKSGAPPPPRPPAPDCTHRTPAPPPRGPAAGLQGESGSAVPGTRPTAPLAPAPEAPSEAPYPAQAEQPPPLCPRRPA